MHSVTVPQPQPEAPAAAQDLIPHPLIDHGAQVFDLAYDAIFVHHPEQQTIMLWNRGAEALYGWAKVEALGQNPHTLLQTRFASSRAAVYATLLADEHWEGELEHTTRDGTPLIVLTRWALQRDQHGTPVAILEIARDITERQQLLAQEQAARTAAERLASRLARLQAVTAAFAHARTLEEVAVVVVEQGVAAMRAYAGSLVLLAADGATLDIVRSIGYAPEVVARFRQIPLAAPVPLAATVRTGQALWFSSPQAQAEQYPELIPISLQSETQAIASLPLIVDGEAVGALGLSFRTEQAFADPDRDFMLALTTQCAHALERARLYEREQQGRAAAERAAARADLLAEASAILSQSLDHEATMQTVAHVAVPQLADWCTVDICREDGTIEHFVACEDPAMVALGYKLRERFPDDPKATGSSAHVIATSQAVFVPNVTPDLLKALVLDPERLALIEQLGYRSYIGLPMEARGKTLGAMTFVRTQVGRPYDEHDLQLAKDLAARVAIAIDNARLYSDAQAAIRLRDAFLSVASHELKTPVAALLGYAQLLRTRLERAGTFSPRDLRAMQTMHEQAQRLNKLIVALLDIGRIQNDQLIIERAPVELRELVQRVVAETEFIHGGEQSAHAFHLAMPEEAVWITGDALRLEQVLHNLLQNATKYSPEGGDINVWVEQKGDTACIGVRDYGVGIPTVAQPQLFQRFYRAPNVDWQQISGLGIGLFVVREIVTLHGGTVEVDSAEGEGSTFIIRLPLY